MFRKLFEGLSNKNRETLSLQLPPAEAREKILRFITNYVGTLPAKDAITFLMDLDTALYPLMGVKSAEYNGGLHTKHRHTKYHDFFVNRIQSTERVLDIGCGNGALASDIAERAGADVVGIDLYEPYIEIANDQFAHPRVTYILGDALKDLPEGDFQVIVMSNVLEHLPDRENFLKKIQQGVTRARFLIRVPTFERDWRVPLKKELGLEWRSDLTHETEYTLESFAGEMADAGLKVIHQEVRWGEIWAEAVPGKAA